MMQCEFEAMTGAAVDEKTYNKIETVYMYYPGIETKGQLVALYKINALIIWDLLPRAEKLKEIESKIATLREEANTLQST